MIGSLLIWKLFQVRESRVPRQASPRFAGLPARPNPHFFCVGSTHLFIHHSKKGSREPFLLWCSIKDDYRTLAELEGVNVVNLYTGINDEDEDHE